MLSDLLLSLMPSKKAALDVNDPRLWSSYRSFFNPMTGEEITEEDILYCWVAWRCMTLRGQAVGDLPRYLYKEVAEEHYEKAKTHPNYKCITLRPNPYMDWAEYDCMVVMRLDMYGNSFDQIVRNGRGDIIALYPLHPTRVTLKWENGTLKYEYSAENGQKVPLHYRDVRRISAPSPNGIVGVGNCTVATRAISLAKNIDEYKARYFENDATPPFVFATDQPVGKEKKLEIFTLFQKEFGGIKNKHKGGAILDMGLKPYPIASITNRDGQFSETEERNGCAICGVFGVPQHKVGFTARATDKNVSGLGGEWKTDSVGPLLTRIQEADNRDLVPEKDQLSHFVEYDIDELLWIDVVAKGEDTRKNVLSGIWTVNEGRAKTKKKPIEGWDVVLIPGANAPDGKPMAPLGADKAKPDDPKKEGKPVKEKATLVDEAALADEFYEAHSEQNIRLRESFKPLFAKAFSACIRSEIDELQGSIRKLEKGKSVIDCEEYMTAFYGGRYREVIEKAIGEPVASLARLLPRLDKVNIAEVITGLALDLTDEREAQVIGANLGSDVSRTIARYEKQAFDLPGLADEFATNAVTSLFTLAGVPNVA